MREPAEGGGARARARARNARVCEGASAGRERAWGSGPGAGEREPIHSGIPAGARARAGRALLFHLPGRRGPGPEEAAPRPPCQSPRRLAAPPAAPARLLPPAKLLP